MTPTEMIQRNVTELPSQEGRYPQVGSPLAPEEEALMYRVMAEVTGEKKQ